MPQGKGTYGSQVGRPRKKYNEGTQPELIESFERLGSATVDPSASLPDDDTKNMKPSKIDDPNYVHVNSQSCRNCNAKKHRDDADFCHKCGTPLHDDDIS